MIFEWRNYTFRPGQRETFINIFEKLEPHMGMRIVGKFRDLDDECRFLWIRSHTDMAARLQGLETFYNSEMWFAHRDAVNATLVDSANVLLLREVGPPIFDFSRDIYANVHVDSRPRALPGAIATFETSKVKNNFPRHPVREPIDAFLWLSVEAESPDTPTERYRLRHV